MWKSPVVAVTLGIAMLALAAAPASASTLVVNQSSGPYTSITDAVVHAQPGDVIDVDAGRYAESVNLGLDDVTLSARPGATLENPTNYTALSITGRRVTVAGLTLTSGSVGIDVRGDGAVIRDSTVVTARTALQVVDAGRTLVERSVLHATGPLGPGLVLASWGNEAQHMTVASSLIVGGSGVHPVEYNTTDGSTGTLVLDLVFSTVQAAPGSGQFVFRTQEQQGRVLINAYDSILHGAGDPGQLDGSIGNDVAGSDAQTFVDPAAGDFHLRTDAPILGRAVPLPPGIDWPQTDLAGLPRHPGAASPGAYELPNRPPSAVLVAGAASVRQGTSVRFDASGSTDPDPAGTVAQYVWTFGDGTPDVTTTAPTIDHVYASTGRMTATVRTIDQFGAAATSAPATVEVTDGVAPALRVISPKARAIRHATRLVRHGGKRLRVLNPVKVTGRVTDAGGVARVDVTLRRGKVKHTGRATLGKGGALSWHSPAKARLARGTWTLTVRATDRAGNASQAVMHFTVT